MVIRWRYIFIAGVVAVLAYFPFIAHTRVPVLGWLDLAFHEAGHVLTMWAPQTFYILAGSLGQIVMPLLFVFYFLNRRDWAGFSVTLAWTATNLADVSVYVADAPYQDLPLLNENMIHDWAHLLGALGPLGPGHLSWAAPLSTGLYVSGAFLALTAFFVALWAAIRPESDDVDDDDVSNMDDYT